MSLLALTRLSFRTCSVPPASSLRGARADHAFPRKRFLASSSSRRTTMTDTSVVNERSLAQFRGFFVASMTAFRTDGSVNLDAIPAYAKYLESEQGIDGYFLNGTSAESLSMTDDERMATAECWRANTKLPIILHIGSSSVESAKRLAAHAEKTGMQAIALTPPTYIKPPSPEHFVAYCAAVAAAAPRTPFFFYHFPVLTGVTFPLRTLIALARNKIPTLAGAKFTSLDVGDYALCVESGLAVMSGHEETLLAARALGGQGAVGLTFSIATPVHRRIADAVDRGDLVAARRDQCASYELLDAIFKLNLPLISAFKALMRMRGIDLGAPRLPLLPLTADQEKSLRAAVLATRLGSELKLK